MANYLTATFKGYFSSYEGLSSACWNRIALALVNDISGGVCYFLSLYFVGTLNINIATNGIIIAFFGLGTVFGGIIGGKLSDVTSPALVSKLSLLVKAIAFLALVKIQTLNYIIVDVFILGVSTYAFTTSNNVLALSYCKHNEKEKLRVINILYTASNLGIGLAALMVSTLASFGFNYIFSLAGIFLFLIFAYLVFQEENKPYQIENDTVEAPKLAIEIPKNNKTVIALVLICVFFIGLIIAQVSATYAIYLKSMFPEWGTKGVGIIFALNPLLIFCFQTPLVTRLNNKNKILMVGVGALLIGFGMFILSFPYAFILAVASCVIYTFGEMIFFSMAQFICYQRGAEKKKGQSLGLFKSVYASSIVVGPIVGGSIYYHFGGAKVWYLSGLIGIACLLACNAYKKYN